MNGNSLKQARLEKNWTQEQAALALDVTQDYLSMMEKGHRPLSERFLRKPRGSTRASFSRTAGHPSRQNRGSCRVSVAGSHKITRDPRTTASASVRSVRVSAVTGSSKNHVRTD